MEFSMKVAVANQKGGVGKTTLAMNLATGLSLCGFKTLAIDNDPQGNLTSYLLDDHQVSLHSHVIQLYDGIQAEPQMVSENLFLFGADKQLSTVPERGFDAVYGLKEGLERLDEDFDYVVIDCLPGLENLLLASLTAADNVLIPLEPAPFPVLGLSDLMDTIDKTKKRLNPNLDVMGIVFNKVDGHSIVMEKEIIEALKDAYGNLLFETKLIKRIKVAESTGTHTSIFKYDKGGFSDKNFRALVAEFIGRCGGN
jgi:chromosome partitioning protein